MDRCEREKDQIRGIPGEPTPLSLYLPQNRKGTADSLTSGVSASSRQDHTAGRVRLLVPERAKCRGVGYTWKTLAGSWGEGIQHGGAGHTGRTSQGQCEGMGHGQKVGAGNWRGRADGRGVEYTLRSPTGEKRGRDSRAGVQHAQKDPVVSGREGARCGGVQ